MIVPSFTAATSPCAGNPTGEKLAVAVESKVVAPKTGWYFFPALVLGFCAGSP